MTKTVSIPVELDARDAQLLRGAGCAGDILRRQPWRFELADDDRPEPWFDGSVLWCSDPTSALLLRAYERVHGFEATIAWDMAEDWPDRWAVLTTRSIWDGE